MLKNILTFLIYISCHSLFGQIVSGKIIDGESKETLVGAHIFVINTLHGTVSDTNGEFVLNPPNRYGELLITYIGYKDQKIKFSSSSKNLLIKLVPLANQLEEVSVNSTTDKKWKRLYKKFEASFLGNTQNAKECEIINPWEVNVYKGENGELIANSLKPIQIINNALGYKLTFYLTEFLLKSERLHYQGFVYFDSLVAHDTSEKQRWIMNREQTFLGSKRHFLMELAANNLKNSGYEVYDAEFSYGIGFISKNAQREKRLLKDDSTLIIPDYLKIVYKNQPPQKAFVNNSQTQTSVAFQGPKADLVPSGTMQMSTESIHTQVSYLFSRNSKLLFTKKGLIINNKYIVEYGYWSWLGVAEMLPYEYGFISK